MRVRFQTVTFNGSVVLHCHILGHEDQGMMGVVDVVGDAVKTPVVMSSHRRCTLIRPDGTPGPFCGGPDDLLDEIN